MGICDCTGEKGGEETNLSLAPDKHPVLKALVSVSYLHKYTVRSLSCGVSRPDNYRARLTLCFMEVLCHFSHVVSTGVVARGGLGSNSPSVGIC